jgi:hypothetical protein
MVIETLRYLVGETCDVAGRDDSAFYMGLRLTQRLACCMRESRLRTAPRSRERPVTRIRECRQARRGRDIADNCPRKEEAPHDAVYGAGFA